MRRGGRAVSALVVLEGQRIFRFAFEEVRRAEDGRGRELRGVDVEAVPVDESAEAVRRLERQHGLGARCIALEVEHVFVEVFHGVDDGILRVDVQGVARHIICLVAAVENRMFEVCAGRETVVRSVAEVHYVSRRLAVSSDIAAVDLRTASIVVGCKRAACDRDGVFRHGSCTVADSAVDKPLDAAAGDRDAVAADDGGVVSIAEVMPAADCRRLDFAA